MHMKKYYSITAAALDLSEAVAAHSGDQTLAYKTVDGQEILLSLYYPGDFDRLEKTWPAIVFVHGGGWGSHTVFADQNGLWQGDFLGFLARYYANKGFVTASIDYRLYREDGTQLIDCYDDCASAMDYILAHADEYKIDTQQVYVLGESAGGHLAGMLATRYENGDFRFKTAFLVNGVLNLAQDPKWIGRVHEQTEHPLLKTMTQTQRAEYLSPVCGVHPGNCPVVLLHGDADTTVELFHSEDFYEKMRQVGSPCQLHILHGTHHAFLLTEYTKEQDACRLAIGIIDRALGLD